MDTSMISRNLRLLAVLTAVLLLTACRAGNNAAQQTVSQTVQASRSETHTPDKGREEPDSPQPAGEGEAVSPLLEEAPFRELTPEESDWRYRFATGYNTGELRFGYIDRNGQVVIEAAYSQALAFSEGLAPVRDQDGWFYIDIHGRRAFDGTFKEAYPFENGRAPVRSGERYQIIDAQGGVVAGLEADCRALGSFREDLLLVEVEDPESPSYAAAELRHYRFVDRQGQAVFDCTGYAAMGSFWDGRAAVRLENGNLGYIDQSGELVIETGNAYDPLDPGSHNFSQGLAPVYVEEAGERLYGYMDTEGELVIQPQFRSAGGFSEGLARISFDDGLYGFIDTRGELVIPPRFEYADSFSEGVACVYLYDYGAYALGKIGYINRQGELIVDYLFSDFYSAAFSVASGCRNGLMEVVYEDGEEQWFGFIDQEGRVVFRAR